MAGVEETGFVLKRLPEILLELRQEASSIFQDLVQPGDVVDTSPDSLLGRLIALVSPSDADLWEAAQQVYAAFDPNQATGISLDNLVAYAGITREGATRTVVPILVSGDIGTFVTAESVISSDITGERFEIATGIGLTVSSASGITVQVVSVQNNTLYTISYAGTTSTQTISYTSDSDATVAEILAGLQAEIMSSHPTLTSTVVGSGATATLVVDRNDVFQTVTFSVSTNLGVTKVRKVGEAFAENFGPIEQQANTVTTISTPILGWDSVTNPVAATPGRLEETDEELRVRFRNSKFERATNSLDSIYSALIGVDGVEQVIIYENDTDVTDGNGVEPHSFLPIVVGGLSTDIAQAIWENKPLGILSQGNTSVSINDIQGFPHTIGFERPNPVVIYIEMTLTTDANFPANGEGLIKSNLINYFQENFGVGKEVIYSRLFTPINQVAGHQVDSLFIDITPSPASTANVSIAFNEIASLSDVNIVINI